MYMLLLEQNFFLHKLTGLPCFHMSITSIRENTTVIVGVTCMVRYK